MCTVRAKKEVLNDCFKVIDYIALVSLSTSKLVYYTYTYIDLYVGYGI